MAVIDDAGKRVEGIVADLHAFDLTPDGKEIVFDRLRENVDIVLIERRPTPGSIR